MQTFIRLLAVTLVASCVYAQEQAHGKLNITPTKVDGASKTRKPAVSQHDTTNLGSKPGTRLRLRRALRQSNH